jgi:hypothetical protein
VVSVKFHYLVWCKSGQSPWLLQLFAW